MASNFFKKRWQKITFYVTLSAIVIISILGCLLNFYWSPILADKIRATVLSSTDSLYSVNFSNAELRVLRGRIVIENIELKPNMAVYNRRKKHNLAPNSLYDLQIKRLVIDHVHPLQLYYKNLDINQIIISSPTLRVDYEQNRDQDTVINIKFPYQVISKVLKSAHVKSIVLSDVKFKYVDHSINKPYSFAIDDLNFNATEFLLDSVSQYDKSRFLFSKDVGVQLNNYEATTDDNNYHYKINSLSFSTQSSQLNVTGMSFASVKTPEEFFKTSKADCFSAKLDSLQLNNFDFKSYSKYHKIHGSKLTLSHGGFHVFDNPAPNDTLSDRASHFPQFLLANFKTDVKIDTIHTNKINIAYTEYSKLSEQSGTVSFTSTSGYIFNVTNNKAALSKNHMATAQLESFLMNYGKLNVQLALNLTDANASFTYKGHMNPMDLRKVNPVAAPLGMVKIASGKLNSLDFDMRADKTQARGNVRILYNDLKISVLKRGDENTLKKMGILSLLANALVIKRNNPTYDGAPPRSFRVNYARKKTQSIFTYMWKSLFSGIKSSAGYDASTEQTVKQKMNDFQQGKAERAAKKALRKQHRAERRQRRELNRQEKELKKQQQQQIPVN
ncbi:MAG: hypothetical protein ABIN91_23890 [Mucilaginibacter sp.]|uniref:hypothetical protein n=1 Tax=Mucilaginibacter sp. TaxID=1882438 RepID=UPI0032640404